MYLKELLPETEPKVDAIGERLLKAAQIIRERGWCQLAFTGKNREVCALEAIIEADPARSSAVCRRFRQFIGEPIILFNDDRSRTKEQVIEALEKAARS